MGLRQERLAEEIRGIVGRCFHAEELADPRVQGVTVTFVKLTADLQLATVYYRIFSDVSKADAAKGLERCTSYLRRQLAKNLDLRRIPDIRFFFDESIEYGSRIEGLLTAASRA